jgi:tetratricopeptide (TPR) repeat protein
MDLGWLSLSLVRSVIIRALESRATGSLAQTIYRTGTIVAFFWAAVTSDRASEPDDFTEALRLYQSHHFSDARRSFTQLASLRPNDPGVAYYLGRLAWWFDEEHEAVAQLERAARQDPRSARIQNALGDAYGLEALSAGLFAKFGWAKKCLAAHELAVALDPRDVPCRWGLLGYYYLAPAFAGGGRDKALVQAAAIRELDPAAGRVAFATLYLAAGENRAAFAEFDRVLVDAPDDFLALYQIGRCAALSGEQLARGAAALRRCLHLAVPEGEDMPTLASIHFRLGNLLEKQGN